MTYPDSRAGRLGLAQSRNKRDLLGAFDRAELRSARRPPAANPPHTGGTTHIPTRRSPGDLTHDRAPGILMTAYRELTGRTPVFSRDR